MTFKNYKTFVYILIAIFTISVSMQSYKYIFLLDVVSKTDVYSTLDLLYGKIIPIYGGTLPFYMIMLISESFQEMVYVIILLLGGYSTYSLSNKLTLSIIGKFYIGFLYIVNPYTYIRVIIGQWFLLFSYAILPLSIKSFIELLENKERKSVIKFIFFTSLIAFNIHMLIIVLIIMIIIFIFWSLKHRDIRNIKIIPMAIIIFILLNFYWIFPLIAAKDTSIDNIGKEDYNVFAPKIDNLSDLLNIASMYGFWREGYIYAKDFIPYWQLLSLLIMSLAIYGFISYCKDDKIGYLVNAFGVIGIIGFILATGINGPFGGINHWLYDNTILKGFRDSQKFVAMLVFSYAILGGLGINKIKNVYDNINKRVVKIS